MSKPSVVEAHWLAGLRRNARSLVPLAELLRVAERRRVWQRLEQLWAREQQAAS